MALTLTTENRKKISILSLKTNLSQVEIINLLVSAVDEIELAQIMVEHQTGKLQGRRLIIRTAATWKTSL